MEKKSPLSSLPLSVALIISAALIYFGLSNIKHTQSSVHVRGQAEQPVVADRGSWTLSFQTSALTQTDAIAKSTKNKEKVITFLTEQGFSSQDMTLASPRIEAPYSGRPEWYVHHSVILSSTSEKIRTVASSAHKLLELGVALSSWEAPAYEFTQLTQIKNVLISQATLEAKKAADQFAKDSGQTIGKIITATQGYVSFQGNVESLPEASQINKVARVVVNIQYELK